MGPKLIPTGIRQPSPPDRISLLLGCSNLTQKGIQVLPRVIDANFDGEIKVTVQANCIIRLSPKYIIEQTFFCLAAP